MFSGLAGCGRGGVFPVMYFRFHILLPLLLLAAGSCSGADSDSDSPSRTQQSIRVTVGVSTAASTRTSAYDDEVSVVMDGDPTPSPGSAATRTEILDDGISVKWSGDDRVAVWAQASDGSFALSGHPFSLYDYVLAGEAHFTADIVPMEEGTYRYFAVYPVPDRTQGTQITCTIPAVQDGAYRSGYDVLAAVPVEGPQLSSEREANVRLSMRHLCHVLRIRIPEGRNYRGVPVTRLLVEFPEPVAGELSFDLSDPEASATLAGGSSAIELQLPEPLDASTEDAPRYAWLFVAPGRLDGAISFTPMLADGYCAETLSTPALSKTLEAGHITPVNLSVSPNELPVTWLDFTVDCSQLGEPVETLTVTAPEGALFRGNLSTAGLTAEGGKFSVGYYAKFYASAFKGATLSFTYDSENAVVADTHSLPSALADDANNDISITAPWLFFEDFSEVESFSSNDAYATLSTGSKDAVSFLSGWTGARVGAQARTSIRIACRRETSANYSARVDSAPVANLKPGASVRVSVCFDYGMNRQDGGLGTADIGQTCYLGYVKEDTAFKSDNETGTFVSSFYIKEKTAGYDYIPHTDGSYAFDGCDENTRFTWRTVPESKAGMNNNTCWLYLDNIRASIVP